MLNHCRISLRTKFRNTVNVYFRLTGTKKKLQYFHNIFYVIRKMFQIFIRLTSSSFWFKPDEEQILRNEFLNSKYFIKMCTNLKMCDADVFIGADRPPWYIVSSHTHSLWLPAIDLHDDFSLSSNPTKTLKTMKNINFSEQPLRMSENL